MWILHGALRVKSQTYLQETAQPIIWAGNFCQWTCIFNVIWHLEENSAGLSFWHFFFTTTQTSCTWIYSQKFLRTIAEHVTAFLSLQSYKGLSKQLRNWDHLLKGVHFDWSYRSDQNVPFHLTKFCPPALLLYCIQLTRTISKRAVVWVRSVQPECTVPLSSWNFRNLSNCTRCITTITNTTHYFEQKPSVNLFHRALSDYQTWPSR